jgi:hypothetical protein
MTVPLHRRWRLRTKARSSIPVAGSHLFILMNSWNHDCRTRRPDNISYFPMGVGRNVPHSPASERLYSRHYLRINAACGVIWLPVHAMRIRREPIFSAAAEMRSCGRVKRLTLTLGPIWTTTQEHPLCGRGHVSDCCLPPAILRNKVRRKRLVVFVPYCSQ